MQTALQTDYVPVEDYLTAEEASEVRHEYLGGLVYAMAGETRTHNQISQNLMIRLRQHLKGGPCKVYMSDIRVHFDLRQDQYYYYPDIVVTCDPRDTHIRFVHHPKLIIEVMSPSTQRIDKREKMFAYTTLDSLEEYALIAQDRPEAIVFRRVNDWLSEKTTGVDASLSLNCLQLAVPFSAVYEGV